jgi:hypothetical protein
MLEHPAPWWYRLLSRLFPSRCREIPEAQDPSRILLRQFALVKRRAYLQQFAGPEDERFFHSHPFRRVIAIGLWGGYTEHRLNGPAKRRRAPYFYTMDASVFHRVNSVTPGHTAIFFGVGKRDDDLKNYVQQPERTPWDKHIRKFVARI